MRREKPKRHLLICFGLAACFVTILLQLHTTTISTQAATTTASIIPSSISAVVGQNFDVNITITDVSNLYGWEFRLSWNANLLNLTSVTEGPFLKSSNRTFFSSNFNSTSGVMVVDCTLMGNVPGVSGTGTLSTITFHVENAGQGQLSLYGVTLVDPNNIDIPAVTTSSYGYFGVLQDLAVTRVDVSPAVVYPGSIVNINVTVQDQGSLAETFNTTVFANAEVVGFSFNSSLDGGKSTTIPLTWDTNGFARGDYTVSASVSVVPGEVNTTNNNKQADSLVTLLYNGHDTAVAKAQSSKTVVGQGYCALITATVKNYGIFTETFNTTVYANNTVVQTQTVSLQSGMSVALAFLWNTTSFAMGTYQITCFAQPVQGETNTSDNTLLAGYVTASLKGDLSSTVPYVPDGKVDMRDVSAVARPFGTHAGDSLWNANADVSGPVVGLPDGTIDMRDVATVARFFGT